MHVEEISAEAPPLERRGIMRQRWSEVSFLHWRVDPRAVAPHLPAGCVPDVVDGTAWVGLVAFQMSRTALFGGPRIPWLGDFPEVNVRLYSVDSQGRRGVVFLSLEASRLVPVLVARAAFGLRYQWASMSIRRGGGSISYTTRRHGRAAAASRVVVRPVDDAASAAEVAGDPVATALTARWAFHEVHLGRTLYCRNHHEPWPLQRAELVRLDDTLLAIAGFEGLADRAPDSVLYAEAVHTVFASPGLVPT